MTASLQMTGAQLIEELSQPGDGIAMRIMLQEAARIVDRLNRIDALLSGDENLWARLVVGRDSVLEVKVDHVLQESRQQTTVLRHLLAEISRSRGGDPGDDDADGLNGL